MTDDELDAAVTALFESNPPPPLPPQARDAIAALGQITVANTQDRAA